MNENKSNVKKIGRTIYLDKETWDYINLAAKMAYRKQSQEVEYIIRKVQKEREANNVDAVNYVTRQSGQTEG